MKNKILSLLLALVLILEILPTTVFASGDESNSGATSDSSATDTEKYPDTEEKYIEGKVKLSCDGCNPVLLNRGDKLYAFTKLDESLGNNARYSWEILIGDGKWASISGYVFHFAVISEALLQNAKKVNGAARLRCIVTVDDDKYVSDILEVITPAAINTATDAAYSSAPKSSVVSSATYFDAPKSSEVSDAASSGATQPEENFLTASALTTRSLSDEPNFLDNSPLDVFQIVINYTYRHETEAPGLELDGSHGANTFTVTLPNSAYYTGTIATPLEIGYLPYVKISQAKYVTGAPQDADALARYIEENKIAYGKKTTYNDLGEEQLEDEYYVPANSIKFDNQIESVTVEVFFIPQEVTYSIKVYEQNLYDDEYTLAETITMTGISNSRLGEGLDVNRVGFSSLYYDPDMAIAEDGSFVLELYYDRIYYLVDFDLNDNDEAYGVTNHYARYKTTVVLPPATRPGYTFLNWTLTSVKNDLKDTEQVTDHIYPTTADGGYIINSVEHNLNYIANWKIGKTSYTVIYWLENADDSNFTLASFKTVSDVTPGTKVSAKEHALSISDASCFTFCEDLSDKDVVVSSDGTTAINAYYLRNYYTMSFSGNFICSTKEHKHTDACKSSDCGKEAHVHTLACGSSTLTCGKEEHVHVDGCCSLTEHAHDNSCCTIQYHVHGTGANSDCTKPEHPVHHAECFTRNTPKDADSLTDSNQKKALSNLQSKIAGPLNGYVYRTRVSWNGTIYNFLFVHDKWFYLGNKNDYNGVTCSVSDPSRSSGSVSSGAATCICGYEVHTHGDGSCTCPITEHDHTSGCTCSITRHVHGEGECIYSVCGKDQHRHTAKCYQHDCGKDEHTHTGDCKRECQLIEHTHATDCDTKKNRTFLQFKAKYDADISKIWTEIGELLEKSGESGLRWEDSKETYFKEVLVYVPFMPPANITFQSNAGTASTNYTISYYLESLDTEDKKEYKDKYFDLSNQIVARYNYLTPDEDFFDIRGFTQFESDPAASGGQIKSDDQKVSLYYSRNEYKLEFVSLGTTLSAYTKILKYQQPIGESFEVLGSDVPYPSTKEKGAIRFVGWYSTPNCADGTEFSFDGSTTMPIDGLVLYAKWETCSYTVNIYTDKSKTKIFDTQTVLFDSFIDEPNYLHIQHPELGGDHPGGIPDGVHPDTDSDDHKVFTGWYYLVDGSPVRFDFNTMSVKFDMEIYAGWTTRTPVPYSVRYVYFNGTEYVDIAEPSTGLSLASITKSFTAKVGQDLYEDFRVNYFPDIRSHTMEMSDDGDENVFLFVYSSLEEIQYTVSHNFVDTTIVENNLTALELILGQGKNSINFDMSHIISGESVTNQAASIAVSFREGVTKENIIKAVKKQYGKDLTDAQANTIWGVITNLSPDYYIQDLILTTDSDQNVAEFKWGSADGKALYQVIYYIESVDGTEYLINSTYQALVTAGITVNALSSELLKEIQYFTFDETNPLNITSGKANATQVDPSTGSLAKGLVLKLYYKRNSYDYTVKYYREGTTEKLLEEKKLQAKYQQVISVSDVAEEIDGYTLINGSVNQEISANNNQAIICYYQGLQVNYQYQILGMGGTIAEPTDTVRIGGARPELKTLELWNDGYTLTGWYYSIGVGELIPANADWISNDGMSIWLPAPEVDLAGKTIYVYAEVVPTTRRFSVEGFQTDENDPQAFVFRLTGKLGTPTAGIDVTFTIFDIGHTDIEHLPYGEYTLTTLHWAWRFGHPNTVTFNDAVLDAATGSVTLHLNTTGDVIITYPSTAINKWLTDAASGTVPLHSPSVQ